MTSVPSYPMPAPMPFDPLSLSFASGQELYKSALISSINARRLMMGRAPVGWPAVGSTPNEILWREGPAMLRRFAAPGVVATRGPRSKARPLLLVCSLINRPYVLDLLSDRSVVLRFLAAGLDVWLIDWGTPVPSDAQRRFDDYAAGVLPRAAQAVMAETGADAVHVLGYCMGGTIALASIGAGFLPAASLIALATPVDLHDGGLLSAWCRAPGLDPKEIAAVYGNLPPWLMQPAFKMLDPVGLISKFRHLETKLGDDEFIRFFLAMETWLEDSVAFPGGAFADWVTLYRDNALVRGTARLGGREVSLQNVTCPILNIMAEADYISPAESSRALAGRTGAAMYEEITMPGGHIGLSTGGAAHRDLWPRAAAWIHECDAGANLVAEAEAEDLRDRTKAPEEDLRDRKKATKPRANGKQKGARR